jgi:hypothetical protein
MEATYDNALGEVDTPFSLRKFLYYSTLASLFSEALLFDVGPFNLALSHLLLLLNLLLMLLLAQFSIPKKLILLALYLGTSGAIGIAQGTDAPGLVAKQLLGILISAFYFYNFFQLQDDRFERAFHDYAIGCYWCAIVGLLMVPFQILLHSGFKVHSVLPEPAHFATACLPGLYYLADQWLSYRRYGRQFAITLLAFIMSVSAVAYAGMALALFFLISRYRYYIIVAPVVIGLVLGAALLVSSELRIRAVDTVGALEKSDVEGANLSTFALVANMIVTENVLEESPVLGNGIGSHVMSHAHFVEQIPGIREFAQSDLEKFNADDAASLLLRVLSELGAVGALGMFVFIWYFRVPGQGPGAQISYAILGYFFLKLLRHGHYFSPEQFFLILIYILNYRKSKTERPEAGSGVVTG